MSLKQLSECCLCQHMSLRKRTTLLDHDGDGDGDGDGEDADDDGQPLLATLFLLK